MRKRKGFLSFLSYTVLHYATVYGSDPMLILLLKHGADPNAEARNGFRPLTFLAKARYENIFRNFVKTFFDITRNSFMKIQKLFPFIVIQINILMMWLYAAISSNIIVRKNPNFMFHHLANIY